MTRRGPFQPQPFCDSVKAQTPESPVQAQPSALLLPWQMLQAPYQPSFISLIQTTFTHAGHNLELSFPLAVFLARSFVGKYMGFTPPV